eukprot:1176002-Prorocentrum_minimum.AAC.2
MDVMGVTVTVGVCYLVLEGGFWLFQPANAAIGVQTPPPRTSDSPVVGPGPLSSKPNLPPRGGPAFSAGCQKCTKTVSQTQVSVSREPPARTVTRTHPRILRSTDVV